MTHIKLPKPVRWVRLIIVGSMILACAGSFVLLSQIPTGQVAPAAKPEIVEVEQPHAWCYTKNRRTLSCVPKN